MHDKVVTLKKILNGCQQLERIEVWSGNGYLGETELLETVAKYSPKKFHELRICFPQDADDEELSTVEDLESFFISWANRVPQKSLSFIVSEIKKESMEIIEKFKKLGVIKKFGMMGYEYNLTASFPVDQLTPFRFYRN